MKLGFLFTLGLLISSSLSGSAQAFNPINQYLLSGNGYAFTGVADTGRDLVQIKLKTLNEFQQRLNDWQTHQPAGTAAKNFTGLDTMFRNSAFTACKNVITQSGMVRHTFRGDSAVVLVRKDRFHVVAGSYDTTSGHLPVYFWCQGYVWKETVVTSLENAKTKANAVDRSVYHALLPNWALISGNLCPTRLSQNRDFRSGTEEFSTPEKAITPIRFSLNELLPNTDLPNIAFDYATEARAYLATLSPKPADSPATGKKRFVLRSAERMPEFKGNWMAYLGEHIMYPEKAQQAGMEGLLIVAFVVSETGAVENLEIERGTGSALLDAEGLRVLESMPNWKPGYQRDEKGKMQAVKVYFRSPLSFTLE